MESLELALSMRLFDRILQCSALVCALLFLPLAPLQAAQEHPQWAVEVAVGNHTSYIDNPNCHPLEYFLTDPKRFDYGSDLSKEQRSDIMDSVDKQEIGEVQGFRVTQVTHDINDGELIMKMILVQRHSGDFCEIYHQQNDAQTVTTQPAFLVKVGTDTLLGTNDAVSGNGGWYTFEYWAFDKDGPVALDVMNKIDENRQQLLPKDRTVWGNFGFSMKDLTYSTPVWKKTDCHACASGGHLEITFALKNHELAVVSRSFTEGHQ